MKSSLHSSIIFVSGKQRFSISIVSFATEAAAWGKKRHLCRVKIDGEPIGGIVSGPKKLNAETIASWRAARILQSMVDKGTGWGTKDESEEEWFDADDGGDAMLVDG